MLVEVLSSPGGTWLKVSLGGGVGVAESARRLGDGLSAIFGCSSPDTPVRRASEEKGVL
jgi:hypothetical protein